MSRLGAGTSGVGNAFAPLEQIFAPGRYDARLELERQRHSSVPAPAPTDPPDLDAADAAGSSERFRGRVRLRRPSDRTAPLVDPASTTSSEASAGASRPRGPGPHDVPDTGT